MNLVLQVIKALFRGLENRVSASIAALTKKVTTAQKTASTASGKAANAQTAADNAQTAATHVYQATVSGAVATVIGLSTVENGKVYTFIPTTTANNTNLAKVKVGGSTYSLYAGVTTLKMVGLSTKNVIAASAFVANTPVVAVYSATKKGFYCLTRHISSMPIEVSVAKNETDVPPHIYGGNGAEVYRYKYMRVKSSTEGSSKLFDIQVDDSGNITAVEVV